MGKSIITSIFNETVDYDLEFSFNTGKSVEVPAQSGDDDAEVGTTTAPTSMTVKVYSGGNDGQILVQDLGFNGKSLGNIWATESIENLAIYFFMAPDDVTDESELTVDMLLYTASIA
eukprot:TRINITY_DN63015_c0_g1_i1.p1 TRINITY_DN63015_c0_g1~~TRINITY_DN63015_c0_g1_i1.p1  ORF type:complete len:117 (+),score=29.56 TRINITY_DN63015_c0_g1_i1:202-552(+)